ncbi:hypothetical protein L0666_04720 [Octadecabacter sp. CECT 8868]|uniref:hypothetical protein n=1 Tax=Octadecabacter algicola TaxID=2909342 RepID=UPI001F32AB02|nr:hypothetical protein [Octadecabacter algicola]MCF2904279.1 hypothetical protein [Octadecabacter algicola]
MTQAPPNDSPPKSPIKTGPRTKFLERSNYRQRRFRDAARWLPLFGAVFMVFPLMWPRETLDQSLTSSSMIYLFALWVILAVLAFVLNLVLRVSDSIDGDEGTDERGSE